MNEPDKGDEVRYKGLVWAVVGWSIRSTPKGRIWCLQRFDGRLLTAYATTHQLSRQEFA